MTDSASSEIISAVRDLERTSERTSAAIQSDIRSLNEHVQRMEGSLAANWEQTRNQEKELVRLGEWHALQSKIQADSIHSHIDKAAEASGEGILIPASMMRLASMSAGAVILLVVLIAGMLGVSLPFVGGE